MECQSFDTSVRAQGCAVSGREAADLVVLAGTIGPVPVWTNGIPRALLPVGRTTLLDRLLGGFSDAVEGTSTICANGDTSTVAHHLQNKPSPSADSSTIHYFADIVPRGSAGCLRSCADKLSTREIFLAYASTWLDDDPREMLEYHRSNGNAVTVFCRSESASTASNGQFSPGQHLSPAGIYCCDPSVLDFIPESGFFDFKEQLVPLLIGEGFSVGAVRLRGGTRQVANWSDYLEAVNAAITKCTNEDDQFEQIAPGIWCGDNTQIASSARIAGPVLIGNNCQIGEDAVIVGPVVLADGSRIGDNAWVTRMIAARAAEISDGACVADHLLSLNPLS
ncbi:MAG: hypothetical protein ACYTHJ_07850 [Planctomycetota bacterium]